MDNASFTGTGPFRPKRGLLRREKFMFWAKSCFIPRTSSHSPCTRSVPRSSASTTMTPSTLRLHRPPPPMPVHSDTTALTLALSVRHHTASAPPLHRVQSIAISLLRRHRCSHHHPLTLTVTERAWTRSLWGCRRSESGRSGIGSVCCRCRCRRPFTSR